MCATQTEIRNYKFIFGRLLPPTKGKLSVHEEQLLVEMTRDESVEKGMTEEMEVEFA
jgi:hypothetical protein